jgi:hypothetical protein
MTRSRRRHFPACKLLALAFALLAAAACFAQDVKENKMAMPLAQFQAAHPSAHCYAGHFHKEALSPGEEMCRLAGGDLKLANVAVRSWKAYFYNGNLYRLLYEVDPKGYTDLYYVLIDLYGQPVKNAPEKDYAPPDDLSESADYPFQFGDGWRAPASSGGDMHINMWYTETNPDMYVTPPKKNVTVEFVLQSVLTQLYNSGKPHKKHDSL